MYLNYGDYDFFEYGVLVDDRRADNGEYDILYCRPFDDADDLYYFGDCTVDINDSWIDKKAVMSFIGMTDSNFDPVQFAIGCIDYYGVENFEIDYYGVQLDKSAICDILKYKMIASDNLHIDW